MPTPAHGADAGGGEQVPEAAVRSALRAVLESDGFTASPRLQQFLSYVVEETLAERGGLIKGKTIAIDVYGRDLTDGGGAQNLVRVEARRLRRLLDEYYNEAGRTDAVRIRIDPGGYTPRFLRVGAGDAEPAPEPAGADVSYRDRPGEGAPTQIGEPQIDESQSDPVHGASTKAETAPPSRPVPAPAASRLPRLGLLAMLLAVAVIAVAAILLLFRPGQITPSPEAAMRSALREQSVPTLQAANLAAQARGMFFPVFDVRRQELALGMYRHAIDLAPTLPDGYAGAAQTLATLSVMTPDPDRAKALSGEALEMAETAVQLNPTGAWSQAALAWALGVAGQAEEAEKHARIALDLAPQDGHVLDLVGITAVIINVPELAAEVAAPDRPRSGVGRFGANNIWATSQLMLEDYPATIEAFTRAPQVGAPVSAPSLIFLAVAQHESGDTKAAADLIGELNKTWPDFPAEFLATRIFHANPTVREQIKTTLRTYGGADAAN